MKKIYYLKTCSTCTKIIKELNLTNSFVFQDIKTENISPEALDHLAQSKSYEELFNKRAQKFKAINLKNKQLNQQDYRQLILQEYTFLKRPVFVIENKVFAGNSKAVIENVKKQLEKLNG
ncbi:MAG: hypothetical protein M3Q58_14630 [Bacteroidota bacterium]|nr:hypothetical protein [Bacteroidota bacterium]